ncbi:MAG: hypothetical protein U0V72_13880 [Cytophagales bacterium]
MEYKVLKNKDIDKQRWDACVNSSKEAHIYALSWYLDVVCPTWQALVFGDYEAVFPICKKYKWGIVPVILAPFLTKDFGIYTANLQRFLVPETFKVIKNEISKCLILNYNVCHEIELKFGKIKKTKQQIEFHSYEKYPEKTLRKSLRDAEIYGYELKFNINKDLLFEFLRDTLLTQNKFINKNQLNILLKLYHKGNQLGVIQNAAIYKESKICAVDIFGITSNVLYLIQNSGNEISKNGGMHFLLFNIIDKLKNNIAVVDFMGSNIESVRRFNKNFCNKEVEYTAIKKTMLLAMITKL